MNPFIQSVKDSPFFTVLTKPVQAVIRDSHNVLSTKTDVASSIIRIIATVGFFIIGVLLVFIWSPELALKLESFWLALNAPQYMLSALVGYSGGWIVSYPGSEIAAQTLRVINYCRFGDYDYFLTPSEITKVAKKIIKVESREISELESIKETVQQVLEFCVEKIRSNEETVRDMANVYKRIFTSLRKGDLTPYYEHLTLIRTQEQKMAEIAKRGQAEIAKIERQIQALQDGISVGEVSDSDVEDVSDTEVVEMNRAASNSKTQDMSALQMIQDRIISEIRRIEQEVASLKNPRGQGSSIELANSITAKDLSLQRSKLLERERDAWEKFIIVLIKKKFSIESSTQDIQSKLSLVQAKQVKIMEALDANRDNEVISKLLLEMKVVLDREIKSIEEEKSSIEREYDVVAKEVESSSAKLDTIKREKMSVDEEIEGLVAHSMEEIKQRIFTLNEKIIENQINVANLEIEIGLKEQEKREIEIKLSEIDKQRELYDVEAAMSAEDATLDMSASDEHHSREFVTGSCDDGLKEKADLERASLVEVMIKLSRHLEKHYIHIRELEMHNRAMQSQTIRARKEMERLSIGHIISSSMEDKYGENTRYLEQPGVLPPESMPVSSYSRCSRTFQEDGESFDSGYGLELVKRFDAEGGLKGFEGAEGKNADELHTRQVRIEAESPPVRVRRRNYSSTTTHQYSRHLSSRDIRERARHVHDMSQEEKESMIKRLRDRKRHLNNVAQRAERKSKVTY